MIIEQFERRSFPVDAVRVTESNFDEVVVWCDGTVRTETDDAPQGAGEKYIKVRVDNPLNERQTKAFVGDWVLYAGKGYKVYKDRAFRKTFRDLATEENVFDAAESGVVVGGSVTNPGGTSHV